MPRLGLGSSLTAPSSLQGIASNYSLQFDGTGDKMTSLVLADFDEDDPLTYTFSWWMKAPAKTKNTVFNGHSEALANDAGGVANFNLQDAKIYFLNGAYNNWGDPGAQDDDAWHHWAFIWNSKADGEAYPLENVKLYIDATQFTTGQYDNNSSVRPIEQGLQLGTDNYAPGPAWFLGYIDEFAIIEGDKSSSVATYMNDTAPFDYAANESDLISWWRFEEGSGTSVEDSSGNGFTGTITDATFSTETPF